MKNTILFIILLFIIPFSIKGQPVQKWYPVEINGNWGIVDSQNKVVVQLKYQQIEILYSTSYFKVMKDRKFGVIDSLEKTLIPIKYHEIEFLSNEYFIIKHKNKYGVWNLSKGEILPVIYNNIRKINKNIVCLKNNDNYQFINFKLNKKINIKADSIGIIKGYDFDYITFYKKGKIGFVLDNFEKKISAEYSGIVIKEGFGISLEKDEKYGLCDFSGNIILEAIYDGMFKEDNKIIIRNNDRYGLSNNKGKVLLDVVYETIRYNKENWFIGKDKKIGVLNKNMKQVLPLDNDMVFFENNFWIIQKNDLRAVCDNNFRKIIDFKYKTITPVLLNQNYFIVCNNNNKYGLVNQFDRAVIPLRFIKLRHYIKDYFITSLENKGLWKVGTGQIVKNEYSRIYPILSGKACILEKDTANYELSDLKGNVLTRKLYKDIEYLGDDFFSLKKDSLISVINNNGKFIIEKFGGKLSYNDDLKLFISKANTPYYDVEDTAGIKTNLFFGKSDVSQETLERIKVRPRYKTGVFNRFKNRLLDTLHKEEFLFFDKGNSQIRAKLDTGMLIVSLDEQGRFIDKTLYKNWINLPFLIDAVKNAPPKVRYLRNRWRKGKKKKRHLWGLFNYRKRPLIKPSYSIIDTLSFYNLGRTRTIRPYQTITNVIKEENIYSKNGIPLGVTQPSYSTLQIEGLVDDYSATVILGQNYFIFYSDTLNSNLVRVVNRKGKFYLLNWKRGRLIYRSYNYIGDFKNGFARCNKYGYMTCQAKGTYTLETPVSKNDSIMKVLRVKGYPINKNRAYMNGGKWGVVSQSGKEIIRKRYDFIQDYYCHSFIASKKGKWGIIDINEDTLIHFKYKELCFFEDNAKDNEWKGNKYIKAKGEKGWGAINMNGDTIIDLVNRNIRYFPNKNGDFFAVQKERFWSLINLEKDTIIPANYSSIEYLSNEDTDFFKVGIFGVKYGFLNENGKKYTSAKYLDAYNFSNGFAAVKLENKRWTFLDSSKKQIFNQTFLKVKDFNEKLAPAINDTIWGFINTKGKWKIKPKYVEVGEFSEGKAWFKTKVTTGFWIFKKEEERYGYINKKGQEIIKPIYHYASSFSNGKAIVGKKEKYGIINKHGKTIVPIKYYNIEGYRKDSCCIFSNRNRRKGLLNEKGNKKISIEYNNIQMFDKNNLAPVEKNGRWGFVNRKGREKTKLRYRFICPLNKDLYRVKEKEYFFIDSNFSSKINTKRYISNINNGIALSKDFKYSRWKWIDTKGKEIKYFPFLDGKITHLQPIKRKSSLNEFSYFSKYNERLYFSKFENAFDFKNNKAIVKKDKKWGLFGVEGKYLVPPKFDALYAPSENKIKFQFNRQYGVYNSFGKILVPPEQREITKMPNKKFRIINIENIFLIDITEKLVWDKP